MKTDPLHFQPRRELGRTGFKAAVLGIGDIADRAVPVPAAANVLRRALDAGLNLIDTAPCYENGYSEEIVGAALQGRRSGVFVIDKVDHFDRPVRPQVEASLRALRQDATDLFVFHGVSKLEDWQRMSAPGGRCAELDECLRAGLARFRGISSHSPEVLLAALESGWCDVILFPVGPHVDARYIESVLPLARRLNAGTVGFKTFGAGMLVGDTLGYGRPLEHGAAGLPRLTPAECVQYTLTCDPDVALLGMSTPEEQDAAFAATENFHPLPPEQMADLRHRAAEAVRGKGKCWWNGPVNS